MCAAFEMIQLIEILFDCSALWMNLRWLFINRIMLQVQKLLPKNAQGSSRLAVIMRQIEMLLQLGQNPPIEWMQMLKEVQCELNKVRCGPLCKLSGIQFGKGQEPNKRRNEQTKRTIRQTSSCHKSVALELLEFQLKRVEWSDKKCQQSNLYSYYVYAAAQRCRLTMSTKTWH